MAVRILNLDWRGDRAALAQQETVINNALATITLRAVTAVNEYVVAEFVNQAPVVPSKIKIFHMSESILQNGISATETAIQNFLVGKTIKQILNLDEGVILLIYE